MGKITYIGSTRPANGGDEGGGGGRRGRRKGEMDTEGRQAGGQSVIG